MIPLAAATVPKADANPWLASIYAGIFTAIFAVIATLVFSDEQLPILFLIFHCKYFFFTIQYEKRLRGRYADRCVRQKNHAAPVSNSLAFAHYSKHQNNLMHS